MKKSILVLALAGLTAGAFAAPIHSSKGTKTAKKEMTAPAAKPVKEAKETKTSKAAPSVKVNKSKMPVEKTKPAKEASAPAAKH